MEIVSTNEMRAMDQKAIHEYGIPSVVLMEHAALAIMDYMREHISKNDNIVILCGPGNNGGDGFALARLLVQEEYEKVKIQCNVPFEKMSDDEKTYAKIADMYHIPIINSKDMEVIKPMLEEADVIVDALFGTGLSRNIEGFYSDLISCVNELHKYVISVDIASGIHGDSGKVMQCAIQSTVTITFECLKKGQVLYPGSQYSGKLIVKKISIPSVVKQHIKQPIILLDDNIVKDFLPKRTGHSHKGSYGKVLMIGGSKSMHGAITLAAKAALHSGVGTLTLFLPDCISSIISMKLEESMILSAPSNDGYFDEHAIPYLKEHLDAYDIVVIGNGMGRNEVSKGLVKAVLESNLPCILDGDAIYEAGKMVSLFQRQAVTILTPHVKEMSYLCNCKVNEITEDPLRYVHEFVEHYPQVTLALKDQHTIICDRKYTYMNTAGNHALAKGGSGDVLCGILAGLFAQGKDALKASAAAVYIHASCADELIKELDAYSIQPKDVINKLSHIYKKINNI